MNIPDWVTGNTRIVGDTRPIPAASFNGLKAGPRIKFRKYPQTSSKLRWGIVHSAGVSATVTFRVQSWLGKRRYNVGTQTVAAWPSPDIPGVTINLNDILFRRADR